jgi:hypothetical protein
VAERPEPSERSIELERPTAVGCVVLLLTLVVILGTALPIVQWRDPKTGTPLPRMIAIFLPFVLGAAFHGSVDAILRLIGVATRKKRPRDVQDQSSDGLNISEAERRERSTEIFEKRPPRND